MTLTGWKTWKTQRRTCPYRRWGSTRRGYCYYPQVLEDPDRVFFARSTYPCNYTQCPLRFQQLFGESVGRQLTELAENLPHTGVGVELQREDIPISYFLYREGGRVVQLRTLIDVFHISEPRLRVILRRLRELELIHFHKYGVWGSVQLHAFYDLVLDGGGEK